MSDPRDTLLTDQEYAELGRLFANALGVISLLGHRSGADLARYCIRSGDELRDLVIDAFVMGNIGEVGSEARDRVQEFVLRRHLDHIAAVAIEDAQI